MLFRSDELSTDSEPEASSSAYITGRTKTKSRVMGKRNGNVTSKRNGTAGNRGNGVVSSGLRLRRAVRYAESDSDEQLLSEEEEVQISSRGRVRKVKNKWRM
mgnify:FL=1